MAVRFALFALLALSCSKEPPLSSDFPRTAASNSAGKATDTAGSVASDRAVLVALYHATVGPNWSSNDNWLSDKPLKDWYGVVTNTQGRVTALLLSNNRLSGWIPPQLGNLDKLEVLSLDGNDLSGLIPSQLGNLTNLTALLLSNNRLSGWIPAELGRLNKLGILWISENDLSGSIPTELGNLTNLNIVLISDNRLTGCLPSAWRDLPASSDFFIGDLDRSGLPFCGDSGVVGSSAQDRAALVVLYHATGGDNWIINDHWLSDAPLDKWAGVDTDSRGRVQTLWMTGNDLRGTIPPELGRLDKLETLRLNLNQLHGTIPPELGNLRNLKWLLLSDNQLSGTIPPELGNLDKLIQLLLSDNQLYGTIPPELGKLTNLVFLDLQNNRLSGAIPSGLGKLTNLLEVSISGNRLSGCIPSSWSDLYDHNTDFDESGLPFCGKEGTSPGAFDIELVYVHSRALTIAQKALVRQAADRWEEVIRGDLRDVNFASNPLSRWLGSPMNATIRVNDQVDDLRIFVGVRPMDEEVMATGGPFFIRTGSGLPVVAAFVLNPNVLEGWMPDDDLYALILHEMGHCLGFGVLWKPLGLLKNESVYDPSADTYFSGFQARQAFDQLGGRAYRGRRVPVEQDGSGHWRTSVFGDELMISGWVWPFHTPLSYITLASMADIGYEVNGDAADTYWVPSTSAAKPVADETRPGCQILRQPIHVVAEDGRILDTIGP